MRQSKFETVWLDIIERGLFSRSEQSKSRCSVDEEIERLISDLLDRIVAQEKSITTTTNSSNALSLLQNFVIKQIPSTTFSDTFNRTIPIDLNNNCDDDDDDDDNNDDEESNQSTIHSTDEKLSTSNSNESPLVSLQKMLAYPSSSLESSSTLINDHRIKKKKFDKYRLFAEKMLRSTLS